jgi:hypothetical protein
MVKEEFYNIFKPALRRSFWCWLGFHKWMSVGGSNLFSSNVREKYSVCERCGRRKTVYIPKTDKQEATDASIREGNMKIHKWR